MDYSSGLKKNIFVWLWLLLRLARPFRGAFSARRALHWSNHFPPAVRWQLKPWLLPGGCQGNTHPGCTSPSYQCDTGVWDREARALANKWRLLTTHLSASLHITWRTTVAQMNPSETKVMLVKEVKCFKELTLTLTSCHSIAHVSSLSPCWRNLESFSELARQQSLKAPYFISGKLGNSLISSWMRPKWPMEGYWGRPSWPPIWLVGIPCLNLNVKTSPTQLAFPMLWVSITIDVSTGSQADSSTNDQAHFSFLRQWCYLRNNKKLRLSLRQNKEAFFSPHQSLAIRGDQTNSVPEHL